MESKKLVRIGIAAKARDGAYQYPGLSNGGSFSMPMTDQELKFLERLSKAIYSHAQPGHGTLHHQVIDEKHVS